MKNIFTIVLLGSFFQIGIAQQQAQYSMYFLNKYAVNPAYAGLDNSLSMTGVYRNQWSGLPGAPITQNLNAHLPLGIVGGGVGLGMENEKIGSWKQTAATVTYARHLSLSKGILSLGLSAGWVQRQLDGSKVKAPGTIFDDLGNPISHEDDLLNTANESGAAPTVHTGVFFQAERLEVGLSATNLLENEVKLTPLSFKQARAYNFLLSYRLDVGKNFTVHPSILVKSDVRQTQIDFSAFARYRENIFAGASFRGYHGESIDGVVLTAGLKLSERITFGYAYDLTLSSLNTVSNGSHEILLNYNLGKPLGKGKPPRIIYNPRSL